MRIEKQPQEKKPEKFVPPQPMGKIVTLAVLVIVSTALFWLAWHNALVTGITFDLGTQNILVVVSTLLAFCLMFTLLAVAEVLIVKTWIELIITILAAGTVFIFFTPSLWCLVGFLLVVLAFLYWRREIRIDEKSRLKFMPRRTITAGLRSTVMIILLAVSFVYYSFMVTGPDASIRLTDSIVDGGNKAVHNVLQTYYKERYSPRIPLDDFIANISAVTREEVPIETGTKSLDEVISEGLSAVQADLVVKARDDFLETFGIEASGDEEMSVVVERIVRKNVDKYIDPYKKFIPALLALSLFLLLSIFRFIYNELIKSFSFLLFHILVWTKFIKVKKIQVEAEKITL